jgi:Cyclin, N-terminal domain/Cyclin, C-terminal domain
MHHGASGWSIANPPQLKCLPCVASIDIQTEIEWFMRPYLLDFLIEAHAAFGLQEETLFLAVNILDRYCSKRVVYRKHYQLVGCTALLIASKYGECSKKVPHVKELAGMCCSLYDEDMFIQMERHIMMTLDWYIGAPTVDGFLQAAVLDGPCDSEVEHMALYISQIALFHRDFVSKRTSDIAKSSLALARIVLNRQQPPAWHWVSDFDSGILVALSQHLHRPSQILLQKFRAPQLSKVASSLEDFLTRHAAIARCTFATAAPLTPPAEQPTLPSNAADISGAVMSTPQKGPRPDMMHGCLTPPITPDSEQFYSFDPHKYQAQQHLPETPSSDPNHLGVGAAGHYHNVPQIYVQPAM